jgi:hypothetical protein
MMKLICVAIAACFLIPSVASAGGPLGAIERCFQHPLSCLAGRTEWKANSGSHELQRDVQGGHLGGFRPSRSIGRPKTVSKGGATRSIEPVAVVQP